MSQTTYLVTTGDYSDYRVVAVFSTEAGAKQFADRFNYSVSPCALDPVVPPELDGWAAFGVWMSKDGTLIDTERGEYEQLVENKTRCIFGYGRNTPLWVTYTVARDQEHAVKIANEQRTSFLANHPDRWGDVKFLQELQEHDNG